MKKLLLSILAVPVIAGGTLAGIAQFQRAYATAWTGAAINFAAVHADPSWAIAGTDGSASYHFGLFNDYTISCRDGASISMQLPKGASLIDEGAVDRLCRAIS